MFVSLFVVVVSRARVRASAFKVSERAGAPKGSLRREASTVPSRVSSRRRQIVVLKLGQRQQVSFEVDAWATVVLWRGRAP